MPEQVVERFRPTSGQFLGWLGMALLVTAVVLGLVDPDAVPAPVAAGALVLAVLDWAAMLRPRLSVEGRWLVMRNMLQTVRIPLAAIEEVAVRQVTAVRVGEKRYVSPAVGRSLRQAIKTSRTPSTPGADPVAQLPVEGQPYADFVEGRLLSLAEQARTAEGVARYSDEQVALGAQVRREPAWIEIVLLAFSLVVFVVTLAL